MKKFLMILMMFIVILAFCTVSYAKVEVPETVRIKLNDGEIIELDLDEYLYGVVRSEMGIRYKTNGETKDIDIEALKAQAVASRTYAVYKINSSSNNEYDLTATTSDQVYNPNNVTEIVRDAVDSTSGQVMTYNGNIICAYFFSTSGGHTEAPENVWYSSLPYLKGVEDPYEPYIEGKSEWEARIPASKYGKMEILNRNENGRVMELKVGKEVYTKNNIRTKLGASTIKSTWFELEYDEDTDEYVFTGKGYGHGVGMSQYGAMGMAEAGFNYKEILNWYYQGIEIEPDDEQYIVVDKNHRADEEVKVNDYNSYIPKVDGTKNEKEYGPMLKAIIEKINNWR